MFLNKSIISQAKLLYSFKIIEAFFHFQRKVFCVFDIYTPHLIITQKRGIMVRIISDKNSHATEIRWYGLAKRAKGIPKA